MGDDVRGRRRRSGCAASIGVLAALVGLCLGVIGRGGLWLVRSWEAAAPVESGCPASTEPAIAAATAGDVDAVRQAIDAGWDPNERDAARNTALACAGPEGHLEAVEALLAAGADPGTVARDGDTVLADAVRFCQAGVAEALLDAGADPVGPDRADTPALQVAVDHDDLDAVLLLVDAGAPVDAVDDPTRVGDPWTERGPACPPRGNAEAAAIVSVLADAGASPGAVLDRAVTLGEIDDVERALADGADPDVGFERPPVGLEVFECGLAAAADPQLVFAAPSAMGGGPPGSCRSHVVSVLRRVDGGLPLTATEPRPPLLVAAAGGDLATVEVLLAAGADPNAPAEGGYTALHAATVAGHAGIVARLVEAGAVVPEGVTTPAALATPAADPTTSTTAG